ncbi:MAG: sigma-70 family RNA polymerase sigma factor [Methylococcaceae bacterium]
MTDLDPELCQRQLQAEWKLLEQLARKRFGNFHSDNMLEHDALIDEAIIHVADDLKANNWRKMRAYQGKASFRTYLTKLVQRSLEDFARKKFGRLHTPQWIEKAGPLWQAVHKLLCHERTPLPEVVGRLMLSAPGQRSETVIRQIAATIRQKVKNCGGRGREFLESAAVDPESEIQSRDWQINGLHRYTPEEILNQNQNDAIGRQIMDISDQINGGDKEENALKLKAQLTKTLDYLSAEDRLFLRMIFQDGMTVSAAGKLLGLNVDQSSGKKRRLMEKLRTTLEDSGLYEGAGG